MSFGILCFSDDSLTLSTEFLGCWRSTSCSCLNSSTLLLFYPEMFEGMFHLCSHYGGELWQQLLGMWPGSSKEFPPLPNPTFVPQHLHSAVQVCKSESFYSTTMFFHYFFFFFTNQSITFIFYLCSLKLACFKTTCTRVFIDLVGCAVEFWCFKSWAASKHANSVVVRCVFHKAPCSLLNLGGKATKSLLVLNNFYIYGFHHCLCTCGILGYFSRWLW